MDDMKERQRHQRENAAKVRAAQTDKPQTYKDEDGCEVTVTPSGVVFYSAADWW